MIRPPTQPVWYSLVAIVTSVLLLSAAGTWYTHKTQRESEQKWCELLSIIAGGPTPPPGPAGERTRAVVKALTQLRADFDCSSDT